MPPGESLRPHVNPCGHSAVSTLPYTLAWGLSWSAATALRGMLKVLFSSTSGMAATDHVSQEHVAVPLSATWGRVRQVPQPPQKITAVPDRGGRQFAWKFFDSRHLIDEDGENECK